jgi:hypothetical protein
VGCRDEILGFHFFNMLFRLYHCSVQSCRVRLVVVRAISCCSFVLLSAYSSGFKFVWR